ncbi:hypothetical protein V1477_005807 [Vespula maculifrons]|uniref:Uncharacterized protein n=1 Tax=Vespula maculifrons TaxID=7453 RepID=A0ABD2CMG1_VESMC
MCSSHKGFVIPSGMASAYKLYRIIRYKSCQTMSGLLRATTSTRDLPTLTLEYQGPYDLIFALSQNEQHLETSSSPYFDSSERVKRAQVFRSCIPLIIENTDGCGLAKLQNV